MRARARACAATVLAVALFGTALSAAPKKTGGSDTVILNDGTMLQGTVTSEDASGVTIKLTNGKVRKIKGTDVKLVDRAATPATKDTDDDAPAVSSSPAPSPAEPAKNDDDAKKPEETASVVAGEDRVRGGVGIDLGLVLSRENAQGKLTVLSPKVATHGALDVPIVSRLSFRGEFALSTFSRNASITVPESLDTRTTPVALTTQVIHNDERIYEVEFRPQLAVSYTDALLGRVGPRFALTIAHDRAAQCAAKWKTDLGYGFDVVPIAAKVPSSTIELDLFFSYERIAIYRCDVPLPGGFQADAGNFYQFGPVAITQRIAVGTIGLGGTYFF